MLTDAIASYVNSLNEREFDAPFMALLRLQGFLDIHFLHGSFEFGKDFIAKGTDEGKQTQLLFQTKAGDINLTDWSALRGQIDMLRTDSLAIPTSTATFRARRFLWSQGGSSVVRLWLHNNTQSILRH